MFRVTQLDVERRLLLGAAASGNQGENESWMELFSNSSLRMKFLSSSEYEVGVDLVKVKPPAGKPVSAAVGWGLESTLLPLLLTARVLTQSIAQLQDDACTATILKGNNLGLDHEIISAKLLYSLVSEECSKYPVDPAERLLGIPPSSFELRTGVSFSAARFARLNGALVGIGKYLDCLRRDVLLNGDNDEDCDNFVAALSHHQDCRKTSNVAISNLAKSLSVRLFNRFAMDATVAQEDKIQRKVAMQMKQNACTRQREKDDCNYWSGIVNKIQRSIRHNSDMLLQ